MEYIRFHVCCIKCSCHVDVSGEKGRPFHTYQTGRNLWHLIWNGNNGWNGWTEAASSFPASFAPREKFPNLADFEAKDVNLNAIWGSRPRTRQHVDHKMPVRAPENTVLKWTNSIFWASLHRKTFFQIPSPPQHHNTSYHALCWWMCYLQ